MIDSGWAQVVIQVVGFIAVIWGLRANARALQTNVALEFMKRYDELRVGFDHSVLEQAAMVSLDALGTADRDAFLRYLRGYLKFCSEEFAFYRSGHIGRDIWAIWRREIEAAFARPAWRAGWAELRETQSSYPEFQRFIDRLAAR